jgi:hypothetical protein
MTVCKFATTAVKNGSVEVFAILLSTRLMECVLERVGEKKERNPSVLEWAGSGLLEMVKRIAVEKQNENETTLKKWKGIWRQMEEKLEEEGVEETEPALRKHLLQRVRFNCNSIGQVMGL